MNKKEFARLCPLRVQCTRTHIHNGTYFTNEEIYSYAQLGIDTVELPQYFRWVDNPEKPEKGEGKEGTEPKNLMAGLFGRKKTEGE